MKNKIQIVIFLISCCFFSFNGISSVEARSCNINYLQELDQIRLNPTNDYVLCRDLDFDDNGSYDQTDVNWETKKTTWTTGAGWPSIGNNSILFTGSFNGQNYSIANLYINSENDYASLFGRTGPSGEIINLGVINVNVIGIQYSSILVGWNSGLIDNCYVSGQLLGKGGAIGGLVGYNSNTGTIQNSYNLANITGENNHIGGIAGSNDEGNIISSYNQGDIFGSNMNIVGGIAGQNVSGLIQNSYNQGEVLGGDEVGGIAGVNAIGLIQDSYNQGEVLGEGEVGGIVGKNIGSASSIQIKNSYNLGDITAIVNGDNGNIGGLVGLNYTIIEDSYSIGVIFTGESSYDVGGLVGKSSSGKISNSYSKGSVSGGMRVGGLVGQNYDSSEIINSYSNSNVLGHNQDIGGLVGYNLSAKIDNSYSIGNVQGGGYVGGLIGRNSSGDINNSYTISNVSGTGDYIGVISGHNTGIYNNLFWYNRDNGISCNGSGLESECTSVDNISYFFDYQNEPIVNWTFSASYWDDVHFGYDHPVFSYQEEVEREESENISEDPDNQDNSSNNQTPNNEMRVKTTQKLPWNKNPLYQNDFNYIKASIGDIYKIINELILLFSVNK